MSRMRAFLSRGLILCLVLAAVRPGFSADTVRTLPESFLRPLIPRSLGPANMGGRVTAVAVVEKRPATLYVASASGGLWKTLNNGITWTPVFEREATVSLGA